MGGSCFDSHGRVGLDLGVVEIAFRPHQGFAHLLPRPAQIGHEYMRRTYLEEGSAVHQVLLCQRKSTSVISSKPTARI